MARYEFFLASSLEKVFPAQRPAALSDGARLSVWRGARAAVQLVYRADGAAPGPDIDRATQAEFVRFREGVASLLEGSSYLLFCSGPAEDPDTQQAVENILAGLDALEARLYSNAG